MLIRHVGHCRKVDCIGFNSNWIVEDAIPLNHFMPMDTVVYQPGGVASGHPGGADSEMPQSHMRITHQFCLVYIVSLSPILGGLVLASLVYFWSLACSKLWLMYCLLINFWFVLRKVELQLTVYAFCMFLCLQWYTSLVWGAVQLCWLNWWLYLTNFSNEMDNFCLF